MTQNGVQSSSIGRMFLIELGAVFCFSAVFAVFFEVKIGLSVLLGAIAYLLPYGLAYLVCFGKMPGCVSLLSKVPDIQKKSHAAGGFIAAELIKILLTAITMKRKEIAYCIIITLAIITLDLVGIIRLV